jgi:putative inorganic carbon (hco3(-)) transporter
MGFLLTLLYIGLTILSPADLFPALASFRLMIWVALLAGVASLPNILKGDWLRSPQTPLMVGLLCIIALSRLLNGSFGGAPAALISFLPIALIFFLLLWNLRTPGQLRTLVVLLVGIALYSVLQGALAYYAGNAESHYVVVQPVWINEALGLRTFYLRTCALGFLNDPNDFAQFLIMLLPLLWPLWRKGRGFRNLMLCLLPGAALLYGIYLTNSRGALLGLGLMLVFYFKDRLGGVRATILTPVALAAAMALNRGGRDVSVHEDSALGRVNAWSDGLGMFEHSPLWGVGYGQFTEYHEITAHNSFVLCLSELGLLGCFAWLGLIASCVLQLQAVRRAVTDSDMYRWGSALRLSLYTMLATCWFLSRTYSATLYLLLGLTAAFCAMTPTVMAFELPRPRWARATVLVIPLLLAAVYATVRMRSI